MAFMTSPPPIDPLIADRLARLQQRNAPRTAQNTTSVAAAGARSRTTPAKSRRRHAAGKSRVAALLLSCTTTGGLTALLSYVNHADASASQASATVNTVNAIGSGVSTTAATVNSQVPATAATTTGSSAGNTAAGVATSGSTAAAVGSASAGGTFTGDVAPNRYGNVQVQISVVNGTITESTAVQAPTNDRRSVSINNRAVPSLNTETTQAQSAKIQAISGATYTSNGYEQSLQSAIDQAVTAGALAR